MYTIFLTRLGWVAITATKKGIHQLVLPSISKEMAVMQIKDLKGHVRDDVYFKEITKQIMEYLECERCEIDYKHDCSGYTEFELQVLKITSKIPYGDARSYKWIAEQINNSDACRAVGRALSRNRTPILIPCHRVINKNGLLGGFLGNTANINMKATLLDIERNGKNQLKLFKWS